LTTCAFFSLTQHERNPVNTPQSCRWCPNGYCEDCLDWDRTTLVGETLPEHEVVGFSAVEQAFYIVCPDCDEHHQQTPEARKFFEEQAALFQAQYQSQVDKEEGDDEAVAPGTSGLDGSSVERESRAESMTEAATLSSSDVPTPKGSIKAPLGSVKSAAAGAGRSETSVSFGEGVSVKRKRSFEADEVAVPTKVFRHEE